jgi:hypothetical protein
MSERRRAEGQLLAKVRRCEGEGCAELLTLQSWWLSSVEYRGTLSNPKCLTQPKAPTSPSLRARTWECHEQLRSVLKAAAGLPCLRRLHFLIVPKC